MIIIIIVILLETTATIAHYMQGKSQFRTWVHDPWKCIVVVALDSIRSMPHQYPLHVRQTCMSSGSSRRFDFLFRMAYCMQCYTIAVYSYHHVCCRWPCKDPCQRFSAWWNSYIVNHVRRI